MSIISAVTVIVDHASFSKQHQHFHVAKTPPYHLPVLAGLITKHGHPQPLDMLRGLQNDHSL